MQQAYYKRQMVQFSNVLFFFCFVFILAAKTLQIQYLLLFIFFFFLFTLNIMYFYSIFTQINIVKPNIKHAVWPVIWRMWRTSGNCDCDGWLKRTQYWKWVKLKYPRYYSSSFRKRVPSLNATNMPIVCPPFQRSSGDIEVFVCCVCVICVWGCIRVCWYHYLLHRITDRCVRKI